MNNDHIELEDALDKLVSLGLTCNRKFHLNSNAGILYGFTDHKEVSIGISDLCNPSFESDPSFSVCKKNDIKDVPLINFSVVLITAMHEMRHCEQIDKLFKGQYDEDTAFMAMDYLGNLCSKDYYRWLDYNYFLMSHEIDAERTAIINAYFYLTKEMNLGEKNAEDLIIRAVNIKTQKHHNHERNIDYNIHYWIENDKPYTSLDKIITDFDKAFQNARSVKRIINEDVVAASNSVLHHLYKQDKNAVQEVFHEKSGFRQAEMIACMAIKYKPELLKALSILKGHDLSEENIYGRQLNITPFKELSLLKKLVTGKTNIDIELGLEDFERD